MRKGSFSPLLYCSFLILAGACQVPPEEELQAAQAQLESARKAEADLYAPELMRGAEELLSEASLKISEKSYREARARADEAQVKAAEAEKVASENRALRRQQSLGFLADAQRRLFGLQARVQALPKSRDASPSRLSEALAEAESLLQLYRQKTEAGRFSETETLEETIRTKLEQASAGLDSTSSPAATGKQPLGAETR
ncbi:MAG: DUF4398 domain-containing protein [Acidobacteria bacterium]|nr:DUF4398 domain-containing protein [Acidobacteriota bacterium]